MEPADDGRRWHLGALACDGFLDDSEDRWWFNVGGRRVHWIRGAALGGRWGVADGRGAVLVAPRYDGARAFDDGVAWANVGGAMHASRGWDAYWCEGGRWAIVDRDGRERCAPTFTEVRTFTGGVAWAKLDRWGLVDHDGAWLIPPRFDDAPWRRRERPAFVDGVEPVAVGGRWGLIDRTGAWLVPPRFDHVFDLREGVARVAMWDPDFDPQDQVGRRGRFGFVAADGRVLHEPTFSYAGDFSGGRAEVTLDGRAGEIDLEGRVRMR